MLRVSKKADCLVIKDDKESDLKPAEDLHFELKQTPDGETCVICPSGVANISPETDDEMQILQECVRMEEADIKATSSELREYALKALGVKKTPFYEKLKSLVDSGFMAKEREGRHFICRATQKGREALAERDS